MPSCSIICQIAGLHGAHSVPWPDAGPSHDGSGFRAYVQSANNKRKALEVGIWGGEPAVKLVNHPMVKSGTLAGIQKVSMADLQMLSRLLPSSQRLHVSSRRTSALLCTCLTFCRIRVRLALQRWVVCRRALALQARPQPGALRPHLPARTPAFRPRAAAARPTALPAAASLPSRGTGWRVVRQRGCRPDCSISRAMGSSSLRLRWAPMVDLAPCPSLVLFSLFAPMTMQLHASQIQA